MINIEYINFKKVCKRKNILLTSLKNFKDVYSCLEIPCSCCIFSATYNKFEAVCGTDEFATISGNSKTIDKSEIDELINLLSNENIVEI